MSVLPPSLLVITGITGYIGSHVGLEALQAGYRVRGVVRSLTRAESLKEGYEKQGISTSDLQSRLEFVLFDDLSSQERWTEILKGVDGVIHLAVTLDDFQDRRMVDDATNTSLSLLRAAKSEASVKKIVLTSSTATIYSPGTYSDKTLTAEGWNDEVVEAFEKSDPGQYTEETHWYTYGTAKLKSERVAWEFVKREKPAFELVSIIPCNIFGPVIYGGPPGPSTSALITAALNNRTSVTGMFPGHWYLDVRDCAKLHVLGLITPSMAGKRLLAAAGPWGWNEIYAILRKHFPNSLIPDDIENGGPDRQKLDNSPATKLIGGKWISLEQCVLDTAKSLGF